MGACSNEVTAVADSLIDYVTAAHIFRPETTRKAHLANVGTFKLFERRFQSGCIIDSRSSELASHT